MTENADGRYAVNSVFMTVQGEGSQVGRPALFIRLAGCNIWSGKVATRAAGMARGACAEWCDTDFTPKLRYTAEELAHRASAVARRIGSGPEKRMPMVVITGGEPMLQLDVRLLQALAGEGFERVWIETNGTLPPLTAAGGKLLTSVEFQEAELQFRYTVSPKFGAPIDPSWRALRAVSDLKLVLPGGNSKVRGWTNEAAEALRRELDHTTMRAFVQPQDVTDPESIAATHLNRKNRLVGAAARYSDNVAQCMELAIAHPEWVVSGQLHKLLGVE